MHYEYIAKKILQRYWRLTRSVTLGVRAIVLDAESHVLLIRHTYTRGWHFPGGGVEFNETLHEALERELLEETGVGLVGPSPDLFGLYSNRERFPGDHVALFVVRMWEQKRVFTPNREIAESHFFAQDILPEGTTAGTLRRIDELNGMRTKRDLW